MARLSRRADNRIAAENTTAACRPCAGGRRARPQARRRPQPRPRTPSPVPPATARRAPNPPIAGLHQVSRHTRPARLRRAAWPRRALRHREREPGRKRARWRGVRGRAPPAAFPHRHDGGGIMSTAIAVPGNTPAIAAIRLLILTGCRKPESLTLRWDDVDRTAGEFNPEARLQGDVPQAEPQAPEPLPERLRRAAQRPGPAHAGSVSDADRRDGFEAD